MKILFVVKEINVPFLTTVNREVFDTYEAAEAYIQYREDPIIGDQKFVIEKQFVKQVNKQKHCGAI